MKRVLDIEAALRWAYRDELPKEPESGYRPAEFEPAWRRVIRIGEIGTLIDNDCSGQNRYGLVPDMTARSGPHEDAVTIYEAVRQLDGEAFEVSVDWSLMPELEALGTAGAAGLAKAEQEMSTVDTSGVRRLKDSPRRLVEFYAIMGGGPDWTADVPRVEPVLRNGEPAWFRRDTITIGEGVSAHAMEIEVDGFDRRARRPYADAYRKMRLNPDPTSCLVERAMYRVWRAALNRLVDGLSSQLTEVSLRPTARPVSPWIDGHVAPRILPNLVGDQRLLEQHQAALSARSRPRRSARKMTM